VSTALRAWLAAAARTGDPVTAARAAAEAVAADPWAVVAEAGPLARRAMVAAPVDTRLARDVVVPAGAPMPAPLPGRASRGGWDTPRDLARRVVAVTGTGGAMLDPACGTGALLVAAAEAGAEEIWGSDLDEAALAVAAVAVPRAKLTVADALLPGEPVDRVVCNPPFVAAELQTRASRAELRARWPWLAGRFDLSVAVIAAASERVRPGGAMGLVAPGSVLSEAYAAPLRRRWLTSDRILALGELERFPGVAAWVAVVAIRVGGPPGPLPSGVSPAELLALRAAPLDAAIRAGDAAILAEVAARSVRLGDLAAIDTGVVSHGPDGGKRVRLFDAPGPGRVPYADARDFFAGRRRWLAYDPARMHRAKSPGLFAPPKVVVQRIRHGGVRAAVDRDGVYVGHTCTVIVPRAIQPEGIAHLLGDPLTAGLLRIACGLRLDLYPHDLADVPFPRAWLSGAPGDLAAAWGLDAAQAGRLTALASAPRLQ
jgi:hypothetical protein